MDYINKWYLWQNNLIRYTWGAIGSEGRVTQVIDTLTSMERSQLAARTSSRSLLVASRVKTFSGRPTKPVLSYPELRTWITPNTVCHRGCMPSRTHPVAASSGKGLELNPGPTCYGCSMSTLCDTTQIVCFASQRHFHRIYSRLTRTEKSIQGYVSIISSRDAAALPSTATVNSTSLLPCWCLLCHTKIRHGICNHASTVIQTRIRKMLWYISMWVKPLLAVLRMLYFFFHETYSTHDSND